MNFGWVNRDIVVYPLWPTWWYQSQIIDVAVPGDYPLSKKEIDENMRYIELDVEVLWMRVSMSILFQSLLVYTAKNADLHRTICLVIWVVGSISRWYYRQESMGWIELYVEVLWIHFIDANKTAGEEATRQLHKNAARNLEQVLEATPQKTPTIRPSAPITKTIQDRRTRYAGQCWKSKDELTSDVLLWTPTYDGQKHGRPTRTYIQQLCEDTGCSPEDLPDAMNDREKWRERVRGIRASDTTWRWWWWWLWIRGILSFFPIVVSALVIIPMKIWGPLHNMLKNYKCIILYPHWYNRH